MKRLAIVFAFALVPGIAAAQQQGDFGDAPERHPGTVCYGVAYPDLGVYGNFPTCLTPGFECGGSFVLHTAPGIFWLGASEDAEPDGNAGLCATGATFPVYDADECYADGDAGLVSPQPYTIVPGGTLMCGLGYTTCSGSNGAALGAPCGSASWTINVGAVPGFNGGYMNILVDWTQDGDWCDVDVCGPIVVPEHLLVNFPVLAGTIVTPPLPIGPKTGYHWARITLTRTPITTLPWDGSGTFDIGETEDYLIYVNGQTSTEKATWGSLKSLYR